MSRRWVPRLAWVVMLVTVPLALATFGLNFASWDRISAADRASFAVTFVLLPIYLAVGFLILRYRPENRIGWLFLTLAFFFSLASFTREYAIYGFEAGNWPGVHMAAWLSLFVNTTFFLWFILLNLLFPDGRLVSPGWRWLAWLTVAASLMLLLGELVRPGFMTLYRWESAVTLPFTNPTGAAWLHELFEQSVGAGWTISLLCLLASGFAPVQRYRAGRGVERQQIKWLAYFWSVAIITIGAAVVVLIISPSIAERTSEILLSALLVGLMASFPVVVALAVFRYRLYDIDLIIRRTLIYGALTASLALVYAGSVVVLGEVFRTVTGGQGQSQPAIVVSTLAVAALFNPLRRRVQERIDRRYYRRRYDAERVLSAFAETARRETDLEALTAQLQEAVQNSLQPERVSIWLKGTGRER